MAIAGLVMAAMPSCSHQPAVEATAQKTAANPVRHDLEPLTKRFPALGNPVSASWVSGTMGDSRVPGPSLYWIDAVVELTPETANRLAQTFAPTQTTIRPEVWTTLNDVLPHGQLLSSEALDAAFTSQDVNAKVFLAQDAPIVVITALGE
jgi:hypothetical protein